MCGRMTLTRSGSEIAEYFSLLLESGECDELKTATGADLHARYNIAPSQEIPTIVGAGRAARRAEWKRWGLVPSWADSPAMGGRLFNARSETVASKPSFRRAFRSRRCLVPASGFYEWTPRNRGHRPFYFESTSEPMLAFAGLYECWQGKGGEVVDSCTILTTESGSDVAEIHHRMPVLVGPSDFDLWLDHDSPIESIETLFEPPPAGTLSGRAVGSHVNNARFDDPHCLDPPPPSEQVGLFPPEE